MMNWKFFYNQKFHEFSQYYLFHAVRLDQQHDLFETSWTSTKSFQQAILQSCSQEQTK